MPDVTVAVRVSPAKAIVTVAAGVVLSTVPVSVTPATFSASRISSLPEMAASVTTGGVVSTTTSNAGEFAAPTLPAESVAVAVIA